MDESVDPFLDFELRYEALKKRHRTVIENKTDIDFRHRKNRHLTEVDDSLSEITYNTNTNYSKLDWNDTQTQDLLFNDHEPTEDAQLANDQVDNNLVSISRDRFELDFPESIDLEMEYKPLSISDTLDRSISEYTDRSIGILDGPSSIGMDNRSVGELEDDAYPHGVQQDIVTSDKTPTVPITTEDEDHSAMNNEIAEDDLDLYDMALRDAHMDAPEGDTPDDDVYADNDYTSMNMEEEEERQTKRIIKGKSFIRDRIRQMRHETVDKDDAVYVRQSVRKAFSAKLDFKKSLSCHPDEFGKIASLFYDQLTDDLMTYKKHSDEHQDEITEEDILLLMQRQRLIHSKSSLESLAHECLPREYWDLLCVSALAENILYPDE
ncbi:hypothetical protein BDB01DRAFT_334017 [Pilobolus umbonatus]|nr:hypothetical protein BDB01DRAFT_334017 [Pilobolus umbonatus]